MKVDCRSELLGVLSLCPAAATGHFVGLDFFCVLEAQVECGLT